MKNVFLNSTTIFICISLVFFAYFLGLGRGEDNYKENQKKIREEERLAEETELQRKSVQEAFYRIAEDYCSKDAGQGFLHELKQCEHLRTEVLLSILLYEDEEEIISDLDMYKDIAECDKEIQKSTLGDILDCLDYQEQTKY